MNICNTKVKEGMVGVGGGKGLANQRDGEGIKLLHFSVNAARILNL